MHPAAPASTELPVGPEEKSKLVDEKFEARKYCNSLLLKVAGKLEETTERPAKKPRIKEPDDQKEPKDNGNDQNEAQSSTQV